MQNVTALQLRITSRITVEDRGFRTPCWISNRAAQPNGYTKIGINNRTWLTHRAAYVAWRGEVPAGLVLDHLCRERACCNPEHLEPVTIHENLLRGEPATRTHCSNGHPLSGDNLYLRPDKHGWRNCRICRREANLKSKARKRAA